MSIKSQIDLEGQIVKSSDIERLSDLKRKVDEEGLELDQNQISVILQSQISKEENYLSLTNSTNEMYMTSFVLILSLSIVGILCLIYLTRGSGSGTHNKRV